MDPNGRTEAGSGEPPDHGSALGDTQRRADAGSAGDAGAVADAEEVSPAQARVAGPVTSPRPGHDEIAPCPHLIDASGAWRRGHPMRSHRCAARVPPAAIPALIQKRVCLTDGHFTCEFYLAAASARERALVAEHIRPEQLVASRFHVLTRSLPLAVDQAADAPISARRRPALLAGGALVAAVAVVGVLVFGNALLPRATPTLVAGGPTATPSIGPPSAASSDPFATQSGPFASGPTPTPSIDPFATPPDPTWSPVPTPTPTVQATPEPTPTPEPTVHRYRVRRGDTLQQIANRFGTTAGELVELNNLRNAADIKVGQNLRIP